MEIKKGDRFRCISNSLLEFIKGECYQSFSDGTLRSFNGLDLKICDDVINGYFEKRTEGLPDSCFVPKSTNPIPPPPKHNSPTSPSHYKTYDVEAIEMMIRIWGKERVAEWCEITAFKYRCRVGMKDDVQQDLKKEAYYLAKWKELRDGE